MPCIEVDGLAKDFRSPEKDPGLLGAVKALFNRRFRTTRAVNAISFSVEDGELVGFLGVNGAGKTTTLKMLSGLLHPTSGRASVLGHVPARREPAFQKKFSLVMGQRSQLWWEIPAMETFLLNADIYALSKSEYRRNLEELLELLELSDCLSVPVKKLSLGQRMRAELACALLHRPRLLLLDEPTLGLDVVMQKKVRGFIREYNLRHGATILLTSHNMGDVVALCPRVIVIERGNILYDGALDALVKKYADHKLIRVVFDREVESRELAAIGTLIEGGALHAPGVSGAGVPPPLITGSGLRATLEVPRAGVSKAAAKLLQSFPVADLTIEEAAIDDIVRRIFTHT